MTDETMTIDKEQWYTLKEVLWLMEQAGSKCCYGFLYKRVTGGIIASKRMGSKYLVKGEELLRVLEEGCK